MTSRSRRYCILFYKYHPLTNDRDMLESYRSATETLCASLNLTGRVLIGLSNDGEGINGTLAGMKEDVDAYVTCMLGGDVRCDALTEAGDDDEDNINWRRRRDSVLAFRYTSKQFFHRLNCPELLLDSPDDFKWSSNNDDCDKDWFPDLNIKIVNEIISSGGAFANINTSQTSVGYLSPREWHDEMRKLVDKEKRRELSIISNGMGSKKDNDETGDNKEKKDNDDDDDIDTIVIDVRNHKECQIGSFAPGISIDPKTKTFAQFPKWVKDNSTSNTLTNKKILLYCTGGIRCEKASVYIRELVPENKGVYHLKGGIHKYLEEFGGRDSHAEEDRGGKVDNDECLFVGKNFVFDRRGALDAKGHGIEGMTADDVNVGDMVVGRCLYCREPYDIFHPATVCTVCREPVLVCEICQLSLSREQRFLRGQIVPSTENACMGNDTEAMATCITEYHCEDHYQYKKCYFTNITGFSVDECTRHLKELQSYNETLEEFGRKGKQKRRTLRKQMEKIEAYMIQLTSSDTTNKACLESTFECRHCGSSTCASDCWGFHGGNTRMVNKVKMIRDMDNNIDSGRRKKTTRVSSNQREGKRLKRQNDAMEIETLQLCCPPSHHRNYATGLRVPPPVLRILRSRVKGRWCGKTVGWVLENEFGVFREHADESLEHLITAGLVRVNGVPVKSLDAVLRNNDTFERIVHWHEPPVIVPQKISLSKHRLPENVLAASDNSTLYCINKPSTVPVYPAGPYYSNSLLLMVEAQEGLPPKTLIPLHRIDRATSGVMLCATTSSAAGVIQGKIASKTQNEVMKLYLARVKGKFPKSVVESPRIPDDVASITSIAWCGADGNIIEVNAPIYVQHEDGEQPSTMMHRTVRCDGKHSTSRFKLISYDESTDQSLISCAPITGRGHQLRVHLQLIGFPIHNDVEYGGNSVNNESMNEQKKLVSAQSMLEVSASTSVCCHEATVTSFEVESAIRLCKCCNAGIDGIRTSFNTAQLLGGGHAIDLHSYKYCITFQGNELMDQKPERIDTGSSLDGASMIELTTDLPSWTASFVDLTPNALAWLK